MWTWTREQLKTRAKTGLKAAYWKSVFVSLLLPIFSLMATNYFLKDIEWTKVFSLLDYVDAAEKGTNFASVGTASFRLGEGVAFYILVVITSGVIIVVLWGLAIAVNTLLVNPMTVGCTRFFIKNLHRPALVREAAYGYDHNYKNIVETMFFRDMYIFFWSLLFVIPGIIKAYEYRMVVYILAENPGMPKNQALMLSREMMEGQKWDAFVLDLSFLGWEILSVFTIGILGIFYVTPYRDLTNAALYENLKYMMNCRQMNVDMQRRQ